MTGFFFFGYFLVGLVSLMVNDISDARAGIARDKHQELPLILVNLLFWPILLFTWLIVRLFTKEK